MDQAGLAVQSHPRRRGAAGGISRRQARVVCRAAIKARGLSAGLARHLSALAQASAALLPGAETQRRNAQRRSNSLRDLVSAPSRAVRDGRQLQRRHCAAHRVGRVAHQGDGMTAWSEDRTAYLLRALADKDVSYAQIAEDMSLLFEAAISRSAVVRKVTRLREVMDIEGSDRMR